MLKKMNLNKRYPFGALGDLVINSGNVDINAGSFYDYRNIYIETGASLTVVGDNDDWTGICVRGDFTLKGTIYCKNFKNGTGIKTAIAPDSFALSSTKTQKKGGDGYNALNSPPYWGKGSVNGGGGGGGNGFKAGKGDIGGGGGSGPSTNDAEDAVGETGGNGGNIGQGGKGANAYGNNGQAAQNRFACGGGGSRGKHGGRLYIRVKGKFIGTGGVIVVSGNNGGDGGSGYAASGYTVSGGGGGAGGNGGDVVIRQRGDYFAPTIDVNKGNGGAGGCAAGYSGNAGEDGSIGTIDVAKYI